jgi:hypothetical protein
MLRTIRELYFKWFGTPLDREIWYVQRSIKRIEAELTRIAEDFLRTESTCCVHCYSGGYYGRLLDKRERVERQLGRLLKRRNQRDRVQ